MAVVQGRCPKCRQRVSLGDLPAGAKLRCPACKASFKVPALAAQTADAGGGTAARQTRTPDADEKRESIGRYQVRKQLGKGAFGTVYLGFDPNLGREVAIKVLQPHALRDGKVVKRFEREAKVVAGMLHPHIVPVYDFADFEGGFFIVSAYIKGQSLHKAIQDRQLDQGEAVRLTIQLLDALGHAHDQGILHRDVKPLNAQLDERGELFLMDFGLAGLLEQQDSRETRDGAVLGTPSYMAPEQAEGQTEAIGPEADQYSAAVVLFEMLTGRVPFEANSIAVVIYQVAKMPPPRPSEFRADIDANLEAMCLKGLAKKPSDRWPSCKAFADALRNWRPESAKGRATTKPASTKGGGGKAAATIKKQRAAAKTWARRVKFPWLVGGIAASAIIAIIAVIAAVMMSPPSGERETVKSPEKPAKPAAASSVVRLFVPHKVGDVRVVKLSREVNITGGPEDKEKFPPKKKDDDGPPPGMEEKTVIKGRLRTLEVNDKGQETAIEVTIDQFDIKHLDADKGKKAKPIPRGAVAIAKRVGKDFTWVSPKDGQRVFLGPGDQLAQLIADDYGGLPEYEADRLFGTDQKTTVGASWTLNKEAITKRLADEGLRGLAGPIKTGTDFDFESGKGKWIAAEAVKDYLDLELLIRGTLNSDKWGSMPATMTFSVRMPRDGKTGPVKRVTRIEGEGMGPGKGPEEGFPPPPSIFRSIITTETEYGLEAG